MKNGTIITFSSEFTLKQFIKYPFRYIIHFFTKSEIEHIGIIHDDNIYEALVAPGVIKIDLTKRLRLLSDYTKTGFYEPQEGLTKEQNKSLFLDLEAQLGKQYALGQALVSAVDHLLPRFIRKRRAKQMRTEAHFCSKLAGYAYKNLGLIDSVPRNLSPVSNQD
jgi:hypothetical protein